MINLPLVEDVFAIRVAVQSAEDGGFIDNVPGHTPDTWFGFNKNNSDPSASAPRYVNTADFWVQRQEWGTLDNRHVAEENWNNAEFLAIRIGARWDINDNWAATATYNYGDTESKGGSDYNPFVGDLQTIAFAENYSHDEWDMFALTIEADLGFAQLVSATSFFDRERTYSNDRTLYFKYYHTWACEDRGPVSGTPSGSEFDWHAPTGRIIYYPRYCPMPLVSPSGDVTQQTDSIGIGDGPEWQDRFTQEIRLSHQGERFDWLAGLYYEDSSDNWDAVWMTGTTPYQQSISSAFMRDQYASGPDPVKAAAVASAEYMWLSQDRTDWEQKAVFGEVTWHIHDEWQATVGGRWCDTENTKVYTKMLLNRTGPDGRQIGGFTQPGWIGNDTPQTGSISEFVPKFALTWNLSDTKMMYGSYTVGYRTGGINRGNKHADWTRTLYPQNWEPDKLKNYEIGARTRWADNTLQLNTTLFYMDWEEFQTEIVDPSYGACRDISQPAGDCGPNTPEGLTSTLPWMSIVGNAGDAHIAGISADLAWIPADGWDVGANLQYLEKEIDSPPPDEHPNYPTGIEVGQELPNVPEFQGSAWAAYRWPVRFVQGGEMFLRGQMSYTGETHSALVPRGLDTHSPSFDAEAYTIADLRVGLIGNNGAWEIDVFVNNVTDERAQVWVGGSDFNKEYQWGRTGEYEHYQRVFTNRPREYGVRFISRWGN
jgi:outer membrane receptor protein involved in Fe transport